MNIIVNVINYIIGLGATAILPITLLVIGTIFGLGIKQSLKSGITVGIGFIGINLIIGLLMDNLGQAAQMMVERIGLNLTVIDGGWASASAAAWGSPIAAVLIGICILVNFIMILTNTTKTLNVDIWNYWHVMFAGAVGYVVTGSLIFSVICTILFEIVLLVLTDKTAPYVEKFFEIEGVSLSTASSLMWVPIGFVIDKVVDKIPGLNKINADSDAIQKRLGVFGEPMILGVLLGIVLGLLAGYEIGQIWLLGVTMGAVMYLMPKMVKILLEGLLPISDAAKVFLQRKFGDKELYIGLDSAIALGHPAVISTALLLVPVMILLAAILPGNKVLPFGDLASIPFYVAFIVAHNKGNIIRSVVTGTILLAITFYVATAFAPVYTDMMISANYSIPEGVAQMSSITSGGSILNWLVLKLSELVKTFI